MKTYTIPEDELFRLIEACHNENNCIQGDTECKCQNALKVSEEVSLWFPENVKRVLE